MDLGLSPRFTSSPGQVHAVTNQTASSRVFWGPDRGELVRGRQRRNRSKHCGEFTVLGDYDRVNAALDHRREGAVELARTLRFGSVNFQLQRRGRNLHCWNDRLAHGIVWIRQGRHASNLGTGFLEH